MHEARALAVYLTARTPEKHAWTGATGTDAEVTDLNGAVFRPRPDRHPATSIPIPGATAGRTRPSSGRSSIAPGSSARGALVFHVTGGNRPITLRISLDGGTTWVEWATNLGTF